MAIEATDEAQARALVEVLRERAAQDERWGVSDHDPDLWLTILLKQIGHYSGATLDLPGDASAATLDQRALLRNRAVQIAAVALAMVECAVRDTWWRGERG